MGDIPTSWSVDEFTKQTRLNTFTHTHVTLTVRKGAGYCPSRSQACVITFNDEERAKSFKETTNGLRVWNYTDCSWCWLCCCFVHYVRQRDAWWRDLAHADQTPLAA